MNKLLLVDGNNILHRAYHGLPLLKTVDGRYTNAVYGFLKMLQKIIQQEQPSHVVICFDKGKNTFRHQKYGEYKAQRKPTDAELVEQFPLIREVLSLNGYLCLESDEFEADDLMGTLAVKAAKEGKPAVIFSGDKDLLQVLQKNITVVSGKKQLTDLVKTDENTFREKYGIEPSRLIDLKGLMGDASDNIPGVVGVGEKTALKLLTAYDSLEELYEHIDELPKNKMREKLINDKEQAFLSKYLATIITDVPLDIGWQSLIPKEKDYEKLKSLYRDLEFRGMLKDLEMEEPQVSYGDDLFSLAVRERPFELIHTEDIAGLRNEKELAIFCREEDMIVSSRDKRCILLSFAANQNEIDGILTNEEITKYCAELKGIYHYCLHRGIEARGIADAVEIAAYLDNANHSSYQPGKIIDGYLKIDTFLFDEDKPFAEAALLFELCPMLRQRLKEKECLGLYLDVELPLVRVLADMEYRGIRVDSAALRKMSKDIGAKLDEIIAAIYGHAGEEFNINSTKQMAVILFEKLELPKGKKTKTGYSTNNEVLESLRGFHPIIENILDYRQLSKLKSTYTDALEKLISPESGHIHTKFLQTVTTTGRLSSADPNLQNIPVRLEEGRKVRKAFAASSEDHILLAADYSQIELRLLAHFANDPVLIESFVNKEDIHARTAGEIFDVPTAEVDGNMRRAAKAVNFGIIYGISSYSLGNDLGISRNQAQDYIDGYFGRYPNVKNYLDHAVAEAKAKGYAETLLHRRRELPDLRSKNFNLRSFAERTAMNTPLQGSAADIIKAVMVRLFDALNQQGFQSKMILQVHDELILDCLKSELEPIIPLLKDIMEHTVELRVPLTVDMKTGDDWYHMTKI